MLLLAISLVTLAAGPILYVGAGRRQQALAALDGFVLVTIGGLAIVHIIPHAMDSAGYWALLLAALGFLGPSWIEHTLERAAKQAHRATVALALGGLVLHALFDGVALTEPVAHGDHGSTLALAVVLHRLPIAVTIWWLLYPTGGARQATLVLGGIAVATLTGYGIGAPILATADASWIAAFQALIAGSLLHVVLHRPSILAAGARKGWKLWAGLGALGGLAAVVHLSDTHWHMGEFGPGSFGDTFVDLCLETAPALLAAFALAGLVQSALPGAPLGWMRTGRPGSEALRGMAFGLPLPICSCGVIPVYRTLIQRAVPATAAMAFLVATPELGLDAVLISIPLLGAELTWVRVICAAGVALFIGYAVGRFAPTLIPVEAQTKPREAGEPFWSRARAGLRYGFVEIVDHVGPWLVLGIAVAAAVDPHLKSDWFSSLPPGLDVLLFALIGMPSYVCASGATPLAAVLIHNGVSPGAAIAFLLSGPATNVTTFGLLSNLHGRKMALAFGGVILAISVVLGILINVFFSHSGGYAPIPGHSEQHSWLEIGSLAVLVLFFALSVVRQGPRGFVGQVIRPYGDEHGHSHDHDHDHGCGDEPQCSDDKVIASL